MPYSFSQFSCFIPTLTLGCALFLFACDSSESSSLNSSMSQGGQSQANQGGTVSSNPGGQEGMGQGGSQTQDGGHLAHSLMETQSCASGTGVESGKLLFEDKTIEMGLEGVNGTLLSVVDLNGDEWPDLVVRRGGVRADLLEGENPKRHTWVLLNQQGRFVDFTEESGFLATRRTYPLKVGRPNWVVVFGDLDNDGDQDAYSGIDLRTPPMIETDQASFVVDGESSEILLNDGQGHFELTYLQDPIRRTDVEDVPSGAAFMDLNRDGWLDLWLTQGGLGAPMQDRVYLNQGYGDLQDATLELGLETQEWQRVSDLNQALAHSTAWSATTCDLNNDGYFELLAASYGRAPNHLWLAQGEGQSLSYSNHSVASGYAFDENKIWQDDQFARCFCANQPNVEECQGVESPLITCDTSNWNHDTGREDFRLGGNSGATVCADFDGDGNFDLFTTEIRHWWAGQGSDASEILLNQGESQPTFIRPGREALGMTIEHSSASWDEGHITATELDFDNDGYLDVYLGATDYPGNRGRLYHNLSADGTFRFKEISIEDAFEHNRSHGVAVADFDRDGDQDLIVGHSRMRCRLEGANPCYETMQIRYFENKVGTESSWIQLKLEGGEGSNRSAIGAKIEIETTSLDGTVQKRTRLLKGGFGHFGQQNETLIHVGLGNHCLAQVTITWPNQAQTQTQYQLQAQKRYLIKQGNEPVEIETP